MTLPLAVNGRILTGPLTGVQRYTMETMRRIEPAATLVRPHAPLHGMRGHVWEQLVLPSLLNGRPLWSTANSGPLGVHEQVVTIHDVIALDRPQWVGQRYGAWFRWLIPRLVKGVKAVITDSRFTAERLMAVTGIQAARLHVIPLGVDEAFSPRALTQIEETRRALGIGDGPYFLTLGSMDRRRNIATLLAAWAEVRRALPACSLIIAGAPLATRVHGRAPAPMEVDGVHFTGRVPESMLPALYAGALAFVFLSLYEGFGLPVAEAMACGTAVIASRATALPEVAGGAGILLDPFDAPYLAREMQALATDAGYREDHQAACAARGATFSWDACASETSAVLAHALRL